MWCRKMKLNQQPTPKSLLDAKISKQQQLFRYQRKSLVVMERKTSTCKFSDLIVLYIYQIKT